MLLPHMAPLPLAFLNNVLGVDGLVLIVLGLLLFGRRLPEVGKNLGRTIVEFKKGLSGGDDDHNQPPAAPPEEPRRLSSGSRVSVNPNLEDRDDRQTRTVPQQRPRKSLPQTEEV